MFVGRDYELNALERLYAKPGFQMLVVYGRRRIGKTTLIDRFAREKHPLFFTAQVQSGRANLREFSRRVYERFGMPRETGAFSSWGDAFSFVAQRASDMDGRLVLVFDEFPYAASASPELPSALQVAIDHELSKTSAFVVLCGSNEGFMESEVLGRKSPLYGRRSGQLRILPFDYLDAAEMVADASTEDKLRYYATFGGTPYYLAQIDAGATYEDNVRELFFEKAGLLYEEPQMLLRQELREPANYNSVLTALARGATTPKRIAEWAGVENSSVGKYLRVLEGLSLVRRESPFGAAASNTRKGAWRISDPFFAYWYRFVSPVVGLIEAGADARTVSAAAFGEALETYLGPVFEAACLQWVVRRNNAGELPFLASRFGRWWGTDPAVREEVDVDVVAAEAGAGAALLGECKWRNSFNETEAMRTLMRRAELVPGIGERSYVLFTKKPVRTETARKVAAMPNFSTVCADEMFGMPARSS